MNCVTILLFLFISGYPSLYVLAESDISVFEIQNEARNGRAGASVVYGCSTGSETGPCVDSQSLCTSQGGKFVGYCFFEGRYEGVCCPGLNPANAILTTRPPQSGVHFDNTTTTTTTTTRRPLFPTLPTMTTQSSNSSGFPNFTMTTSNSSHSFQNLTMTTQQMNFTTSSNFTMTTSNSSHSFPNFTMTTQQMNFTQNFTMTTIQMPNMTTTTEASNTSSTTTEATTTAATTESSTDSTTTEATTASPTDSTTASTTQESTTQATIGTSEPSTDTTTTAAPPPVFDEPGGGGGCGVVATEIQSTFQNPSYPGLDTEPNVYEYSVMRQDGYCALRIDFVETLLAGKGAEGCSTDSIVVMNSKETPTTPLCGLLQEYQLTVGQEPQQPIKLVITVQSTAHLWNINFTQIPCSNIKSYQDYQSPNCGIKNPKNVPPGIFISGLQEESKPIHPLKLVRTNRKSMRDVLTANDLVPSKLLQNAVLNRESNIKIVRGNETGVNEWPWQALLLINGRPLCGASVINEEWIVTAGHCVQLNLRYPLISVLTVDLGDHDLRTTKETKNSILRVAKIVPNVQNEGLSNDIALIKLASKLQFSQTIRPVCLPPPKTPQDTFANRTGITTGWGRTEDSVISPVLREAAIPILSNEKCRQQWSTVGDGAEELIENGMICGGGGDVGPCNGDSGGPFVVEDGGKWNLVGLTSFGSLKGCAISGVPTVFTRVTSYVDWIGLNLANA